MNLKKKQGLSNTLGVVLLIALSIAALALIGQVVLQVVQQPFLSPVKNCYEYTLTPPLEVSKACYNTQTNEMEITAHKLTSAQLKTIDFSLTTNQETQRWACSEQCGTCSLPKEEETKTYKFTSASIPVDASLIVQADACFITKISVQSSCTAA